MVIEYELDLKDLITFKEATKVIPKSNGRELNVSTIWRWATKGVYGIKLEHVCFGRAMFTTNDALRRFAGNIAAARASGVSESTDNDKRVYINDKGHCGMCGQFVFDRSESVRHDQEPSDENEANKPLF